jgi:methionyl-tRNA formyltransferase
MGKPSVILLGSKPGAVTALEVMLARGWDVRCVVVSRSISHPWVQGPSLAEYATDRGLSVVVQSELASDVRADFVISYMFRHRVRRETLAMASRAALNFHAGPLPEFGGWAFYSVAILENSPEYGCTCHYMDEGFDTGPLLEVRRFPIDARQETAWSLERKAQQEMIRLFVDFCLFAETGEPLPIQQQDKTRARYLQREQFDALKRIPDGADAETVDRTARAFWYPPYDCACVRIGDGYAEVVPKIVKEQMASWMHAGDLDDLRLVARQRMEGRVA